VRREGLGLDREAQRVAPEARLLAAGERARDLSLVAVEERHREAQARAVADVELAGGVEDGAD
jgi:hypothetical protein